MPEAKDKARKERCRLNLRSFCETYFPNRFPLAFSRDHETCIERLQSCTIRGGQFAYAMPRGSGKTTLAEVAALWAVAYGHRRFVILVGATEPHAGGLLDAIKAEVETNDLLAEDFPEVCYPVRRLEGIHNRANGQTLDGERTRIKWTADFLQLPVVKGAPSSGAVIRVAGITGAIRGAKVVGADGKPIRPDLAILDDPQTDESAHSPTQNAARENIIKKAVLGLAGPKTKIAAVMPCTVIAPGDLADRFLDRDRYPAWHGERTRMVDAWPKNQAIWDQYAELRRESLRGGGEGEPATEFYRSNRAAMDAGAVVSWAERFDNSEISAIQHAVNLRLDRGERAFDAEFQNDPQPEKIGGQLPDLDADAIASKLNRCPRGTVPPECTRLTAFIDVGGSILYWCVVGWAEDYSGSIVDYGTYPRQNRAYFAATDARPSLADLPELANHDDTARVYAGLKATVEAVAGRSYPRSGGGEVPLGVCLVDSGWLTDTVHQFCRESSQTSILLPSKGYAVGASGRPMAEWAKRPGERSGWNWRITPVTVGKRGRLCVFDPNQWKSFTAARLQTPQGGAGCLQLFGEKSSQHQLFADHSTSEYRILTEGRGRKLEEWKIRPERADNHWWDCLVGCAVGASVLGLEWSAGAAAGEAKASPVEAKRLKLSELQARKRQAAGR